jgi:putative DNA primase/helicase
MTTSGRWPDGSQAPEGNVLIWSGEDDPKDTLIPRLMACGADRSRVHIISGVVDDEGSRPFDPATDAILLHEAAKEVGDIRLLIVDPIVSAVAGDSHKNAEVRRALQPLVDLGQSLRAAVVGITHLTKGTAGKDPVDRVTGSLAFGALARIVLVTAKLQDDDKRLLVRAKSNIGPDSGGFEYYLDQVDVPGVEGVINTRVTWGAAVEGTSRELLGQAEAISDPEEHSALGEAKEFLLEELKAGPVPVKKIYAEARDAGHSEKTLNRAKKELGIKAAKAGFSGGWAWNIPPQNPQGGQGGQDWPPSGLNNEGGQGGQDFLSRKHLISNEFQPGSRTEPPTGAHYPGFSEEEVCHGHESHTVSAWDVAV